MFSSPLPFLFLLSLALEDHAPTTNSKPSKQWKTAPKIDGNENEDLFFAVKYCTWIDFANSKHYCKHYPSQTRTAGTLQRIVGIATTVALNSEKDQEFYPHAEFRSSAMAFIITVEVTISGRVSPPIPMSVLWPCPTVPSHYKNPTSLYGIRRLFH